MTSQSDIVAQILTQAEANWQLALGWLRSPAAWSQFALLIVSWLLALVVARRFLPRFEAWLDAQSDGTGIIHMFLRLLLRLTPVLMPLIAYGFTALGEAFTRSVFDSGAVIAFGKRLFLFVAVRLFVRHVLRDPFLKLFGRYILIPVAALYVFDLLQPATDWLEGLTIELGNIRFSVMTLVRGSIAGSLLFWFGSWSTQQSSNYFKSQQELRPATRELAAKATEMAIFGAGFLILLQIMGINLTTVAVLGGALGVGIGLGLQQIASNFAAGVILLIEGQTTVGDYVELDGGQKGTIVRMTARSCILETFDGRWIIVPNEDFITTRVINYSDQGSANRYSAPFTVAYATDIDAVPGIIESAVATLPFILKAPAPPACELRGFGDNGIDFAVEYWVNGIDDGGNKYLNHVLFVIWRALKAAKIDIQGTSS